MSLDEADGALWGLTENDGQFEVETTVYKFTDKKTPYANEELGMHKYHILTFKHTGDPDSVEFMKACIGDVKYFIDNHAKAGYNGVMVKDGCVPKKTVKDIIRVMFKNWQLPDKTLKSILSQV
jgi:hypothetical protein